MLVGTKKLRKVHTYINELNCVRLSPYIQTHTQSLGGTDEKSNTESMHESAVVDLTVLHPGHGAVVNVSRRGTARARAEKCSPALAGRVGRGMLTIMTATRSIEIEDDCQVRNFSPTLAPVVHAQSFTVVADFAVVLMYR